MNTVLALDPSQRHFGWAIIINDQLIECGCVDTESHKALPKLESDYQNILKISTFLHNLITRYQPDHVVCESPGGSQSSTAAKSLGLVKGMVIGIKACMEFDLTWVSARTAKKATTGNPFAEKSEIIEVVMAKYERFDTLMNKKNKLQREAAADAVSVYLGGKDERKKIN